MVTDRELTYDGKTYHIKGRLPFGDTLSERAEAATNCTVKVLVGPREHNPIWRTLRNGSRKYRIIGMAMRTRGFHSHT